MLKNTDKPISILIVDDEIDIREILQINPESEDFYVDSACVDHPLNYIC